MICYRATCGYRTGAVGRTLNALNAVVLDSAVEFVQRGIV